MASPEYQTPSALQLQRAQDRRRVLRALKASLICVLVLVVVFFAQASFDWSRWVVSPHDWHGLVGIVTAPLLHGSLEHIGANAVALLLLGTLAGTVYPRATLCALPLLWIGSGLGAWWLGNPGSRHMGASGVGHGLMFLVFTLGLLRRDRPAIAAAMIAFFLYGGMLLTVLPHEPGVSWQSHLGGAVAGVLAAWWLRRIDPRAPRKRYSWEIEDEAAQRQSQAMDEEHEQLELPSPRDVPVLWQRADDQRPGKRHPGKQHGTVLKFRERDAEDC